VNDPGLPLHLVALGIALALAGADAALNPPPAPQPPLTPGCSYDRLRLVGPPLPARHPRYGPEVERWEGWLDTPPGAKAPIPVTCWLRDGRLVELASRGSEPISDEDAALALEQRQPRLGDLPPDADLDLDWIWAELGLQEEIDASLELHFVTALVPSDRFPNPWRMDPPPLTPALLVRLSRHWKHNGVSRYSLFSADGRERVRLSTTGYRACGASLQGAPATRSK